MRESSSRHLALAALEEWRAGKKFADAILGERLRASGLDAADRAFATELFYGVIRNLTLLDFWIAELRSSHLDHASRDLLRLGLYQLFLLQTPEHAAIYETVESANRRNRGLINGVLRNAVRRKLELLEAAQTQDLAVRRSHPQFLLDRWTNNFGAEQTEALCEWNNRPAPIYARINRLKISDADFVARYGDIEQSASAPNFVRMANVPGEALAAGHCYIQDPSTAAACSLLDPRPGQRVLDACAAPGGKSGYIAELMRNDGFILSCDRDARRVATLRENLERLGVVIAQCQQHDWLAGVAPADKAFDRILVDAPCSNTGVMRRRIDVRWRLTPEDFPRMAKEQFEIVRATIPLLKPGGALVYSTCSIEPEENEGVVARILSSFPFLELVDQVSLLPFRDGFDGAFAARLVREL
ncbi:MAG: rRNA (cytosine967-C5)-methyltransferase [Verrucomicrobiota bacterium]